MHLAYRDHPMQDTHHAIMYWEVLRRTGQQHCLNGPTAQIQAPQNLQRVGGIVTCTAVQTIWGQTRAEAQAYRAFLQIARLVQQICSAPVLSFLRATHVK